MICEEHAKKHDMDTPCAACQAEAERDRLREALEQQKKHRAWMHETLLTALDLLHKDHPARGPVAAVAFIETRPLTDSEAKLGAALADRGKP